MDWIGQIDRWGHLQPDRPAHVSGAQQLTYGELTSRSNKLASYLTSTITTPGSPVAVLGHKQNEMLIGFLGALKAGHPYVPLDVSIPEQRIRKIVETASATLLTWEEIRSIVNDMPDVFEFNFHNPAVTDIWYIIFTSGSTGDPKGVMITRGCLESFIDWIIGEQSFQPAAETFLNQAPFSFDLSVMDLYASLCTGGTLFSLTQDLVSEPRALFDALAVSRVSVWVSTPSFARMCLMERRFAQTLLPNVRKFWFCGETLAPEVAAELLKRFPQAEVWNTYGPTEATVATTSIRITDSVLAAFNPLPVGRPKPGTRIVVLDATGTEVTPPQRGEIVIAGPNVSLGYVHRPDLTAHAFFELDGKRAYRTGDWGHFQDGLLFFEGRIDFQIKLHGYRIEIGDIEANLHKQKNVQDAVVIPAMRNDRVEYLVAFTILKERSQESDFEMSEQLRRQLADQLPDYMVPRKFVFLDEFPTTSNGKVDRRKLAATLQ